MKKIPTVNLNLNLNLQILILNNPFILKIKRKTTKIREEKEKKPLGRNGKTLVVETV